MKFFLKESWREFVLFVMVFMFFFFIFGLMMYWIELDYFDIFLNIFVSIWWVFIIMIIIGYGDFYFKIVGGYCIVSFVVVFGLMFLVMFIMILVLNFNVFYNCYNYRRRYLFLRI